MELCFVKEQLSCDQNGVVGVSLKTSAIAA